MQQLIIDKWVSHAIEHKTVSNSDQSVRFYSRVSRWLRWRIDEITTKDNWKQKDGVIKNDWEEERGYKIKGKIKIEIEIEIERKGERKRERERKINN